ncbi:MAG TPA: hypothetical protein VEH47_02900 [Candidatus Acidoferrales bacterium]|nr:hypothetical protein [Candidatus Acidoferrales bacterium]
MPRMLDLIRNSQIPSNLMQSAARGALAVPPAETIEILVHLALHNKLFSEQARLTLAGWDEKASLAAAADPKTSPEVLEYFLSLENLRTALLPALAENSSVGEEPLAAVAVAGPRSAAEALLTSPRVMNSLRLLQALQTNAHLRPRELGEIAEKLAALESRRVGDREASETGVPDDVIERTVTQYLEENAVELAAEKDKPFQALAMAHEDAGGEAASAVVPEAAAATSRASADAAEEISATAAAAAGKAAGAASAAHGKRPSIPVHEERRETALMKIARLDIKGRIALAMRGSKEERAILIRDSTKLVAVAVLESPKVSEGEVETFATQKNVLEVVLRTIPMKRKFAKNYSIMRNLVFNPRTPLDVSLTLMKNLLVHDLKNLAGNKEVADTIRKLALRIYAQKMEKKGSR